MRCLLATVALLSLAFPCRAQTAADVVRLTEKGVSEQVILAFVDASQAAFELSVEDIVKLKEAKVSEKVIVAMLRHKPSATPVAEQKAPEPAGEPPVLRSEVPPAEPRTPIVRTEAPERVVERERVVEVPVTRVVYQDYPSVVYAGYVYPSVYAYSRGYYGSGWGCRSYGYARHYRQHGGHSWGHQRGRHYQHCGSSHGWNYRSGYTSHGFSGGHGYGHRR